MTKKKNGAFFFPYDFGVKDPRHSETVFAEKRYTSIVACDCFLPR